MNTTQTQQPPSLRGGRTTRVLLALLVALTIAVVSTLVFARASSDDARAGTASADRFDSATRGDDTFNRTFEHKFATVDGVRMHYVKGGTGEPLVLLHGWPQTWFAWKDIMPALAEKYTVYALDLPGLGDSKGSPTGYDKATLARYVHKLLKDELRLDDVNLAAHDLGAGVGFQYVSQFPDDVRRYVHMDYPLPGPKLSATTYRTFSWHLGFHNQKGLPETVVGDDVRAYLAHFYPMVAYGGTGYGGPGAASPFTKRQVAEFVRTYQRPRVLSGGFDLYRTLDVEGGLAALRATLEPRLTNIQRAVEVPKAGHWLPEENPEFVVDQLLSFFGEQG
jgi:pimeloyl-ACP methyl ester carboxylesterase